MLKYYNEIINLKSVQPYPYSFLNVIRPANVPPSVKLNENYDDDALWSVGPHPSGVGFTIWNKYRYLNINNTGSVVLSNEGDGPGLAW